MIKYLKSKKGFVTTEIATLLIISSIYTSVLYGSYSIQTSSWRDANRITEIAGIKTALEQYCSDNNQYPSLNWQWDSNNRWFNISPYMQKIPTDPLNMEQKKLKSNSWAFDYLYWVKKDITSFDTYELSIAFENSKNINERANWNWKMWDKWNDDRRYEISNLTWWFINTKANTMIDSKLVQWAQTWTYTPNEQSCIKPGFPDKIVTCDNLDDNSKILVIR